MDMLTTTDHSMYYIYSARQATQPRDTWPQAARFKRSGLLLHGVRTESLQNEAPEQHHLLSSPRLTHTMKSAPPARRS